jgi:hypothetical protein
MDFLSLLGISFVGAIFWLLNVEAAAIYYGGELAWHPLAVGLTAALGQNLNYIFLYKGGDALIHRWKWLGRKVENTRERFSKQMNSGYLWLTAVAALFGIPPVVAMVALASGFNKSLKSILLITYPVRVIRFTILAHFGESLFAWWNTF